MWKGIGRSGIGDQTIIGEYNDWDGLSMNGRQWKNPTTKETRALSGADYWHQRKSLEPKVAGDIPTFVNGRPNIQAFAEPVAQPKTRQKKKVPIACRIIPAQSTLNRLDSQEEELDKAFESGEVSLEEYSDLKYVLDDKRARAHKSLCKALGKPLEDEDVGQHGEGVDRSFTGQFERNNSLSQSTSSGLIEKDFKKDIRFFLTGSVSLFIVSLLMANLL